MATITAVYYGKTEDMIAEVAAWDPRQIGVDKGDCRYLVMASGDAQFDTDYFRTKVEAVAYAKMVALQGANIKVCPV